MTDSDLLPKRFNKELDNFHKLADALGEPVENVYNMPEKERTELMTVMQIDVTVAVTPVEQVPSSSKVLGPSVSQGSDEDKSEASSGRKPKKSGGGKRPFDYESDDDDFVPQDSDRDKKFKFNDVYDEMAKDFMSVYDDGSKQSSSRRQPSRAAARKTNQRNKNLGNDDISQLLDNNGDDGDSLPNLAPLPDDLDFSKTKENDTESPAKKESVNVEKVSKVDQEKDEQYSLLLKNINEKAQKPLMIDHTRDPMKLLEENLPMLRIENLRKARTESKKTDLEKRFAIHMSVIKGLSKEIPHSTNDESMSWIKLSSSKQKTIPMSWSKEEGKPTDVADCEDDFIDDPLVSKVEKNLDGYKIPKNSVVKPVSDADPEDDFFDDLNLDEPLVSKVAKNLDGYRIPKNIDIKPVPKPKPSTSSNWLSKPSPESSSKSQGSKLKLKKPMEKPKITLDHFYDEAKQQKASSSRSDPILSNRSDSDEARKKRLSLKILQHLEDNELTAKKDESDEDEVKFVKEVASPHNRVPTSRRKDEES